MSEYERKLYRSGQDRMIAGVCAGFADYFAIDVKLVRIIWALSVFLNGIGLIAYLIAVLVVPENPSHKNMKKKQAFRNADWSLVIGAMLVALGILFLMHEWFGYYWRFHWHFFPFTFVRWDLIWPVLLILGGMWFVMKSVRSSDEKNETPQKPLYRKKENRMIGGVCSGLAEYWNIDVSLVRIVFVVATLLTNMILGISAYILMLIVLPEKSRQMAVRTTNQE
jgi:phage shock protein C